MIDRVRGRESKKEGKKEGERDRESKGEKERGTVGDIEKRVSYSTVKFSTLQYVPSVI